MKEVWVEFFKGLVPPVLLVGSSLGSILAGLATPTEGAAMGAVGAIFLTLAYRKLTFKSFREALLKTLEITTLIMILVCASNFFGSVFSRLGTPTMITEYLMVLDLPPMVLLLMIMTLIFLLAWPLEWVPIVLIIIPILLPLVVQILDQLGLPMLWFAILVAVNLQTAWLSPPVALSAYFLKGVVPEWDLADIYKGMFQFMMIQVVGLAVIIIFPKIVLWLPTYLYGN
jgi:TRAP-type mannitol/chloroaromatic compound transport system permease large subunit